MEKNKSRRKRFHNKPNDWINRSFVLENENRSNFCHREFVLFTKIHHRFLQLANNTVTRSQIQFSLDNHCRSAAMAAKTLFRQFMECVESQITLKIRFISISIRFNKHPFQILSSATFLLTQTFSPNCRLFQIFVALFPFY